MVLTTRLRNGFVGILVVAIMATAQSVQAGPFENIFRTLKKTFSQPPRKNTSNRKTTKDDATSPVASGDSVNSPPAGHNTKTTTRATASKKGDFPYGTPVPGKKGFVTSPFAPDSGFIDVRDFPPGTPVKDPYTNKIFLTP
jgi:hypothetical protein